MKLLKNIMMLMAVVLFAACDTDVDTPQISPSSNFVAPEMGQCSDVIINADNSKEELVFFTWKAADFGLPVQILYKVYITNGAKQAMVSTSNTTSLSIAKGDFNGVVINGLGVAPNETVGLQAYVTAEMAGTDLYEPVVSQSSNSFNVTTYQAELKKLYVVGFFNGWKVDKAVEIWENAGGTNIYEGMYFLNEDATNTPGLSGFKIVSAQNWSEGNWGYDAFKVSGEITSSDDGNLVLPAGAWKLSVNRTEMSIEATKVTSVDILGQFNNWNDTPGNSPLTYDPEKNVWVSEPMAFEAGSELLVRLNGSWDHKYGASGKMSNFVKGGLELVTGGGDNIKVPEAGTFVVTLHANRTPYVLEFVKQ